MLDGGTLMSVLFLRRVCGSSIVVSFLAAAVAGGCGGDQAVIDSSPDAGDDRSVVADASACKSPLSACPGAGGTVCVDMTSDIGNCGRCGRVCAQTPHASPACVQSKCVNDCVAPWADCNGNFDDGCETDAATDVNACGKCGHVCPVPANTVPSCGEGVCKSSCRKGFADCNHDMSDGCEAELAKDANNCGTCGHACKAPLPACSGGVCGCAAGLTDCSGTCVDTQTDSNNCGACGKACTVSGTSCSGGACVCSGGLVLCGSACTDTQTDPNNCGACGTPCTASGQTCFLGVCVCPAGQVVCGGACVDELSDPGNCGGCGVVCATNGTCQVGTCVCLAPYPNLCGSACVNFQTDSNNCGWCGHVCQGGMTCKSGTCQ